MPSKQVIYGILVTNLCIIFDNKDKKLIKNQNQLENRIKYLLTLDLDKWHYFTTNVENHVTVKFVAYKNAFIDAFSNLYGNDFKWYLGEAKLVFFYSFWYTPPGSSF